MLFYIFPQPISPVVQWLTFCIIIVHLSKLRHWCWHVPVHFLTKLQYLFRFHHLLVAKFSSCLSGLWLFLHLLFFSINFLRSIHQISHTGSSHLRCFYVFLMIRPVFSLFLFNWNMIALQCSVCFCCTTSWISTHKLPPSWASLPPFHSTPLGHDRAQQHSNFLLASYFMHDRVCVSMRLSQFTFLSLLPHPSCPQVHNFASITALEKIGSIFFFQCQLGEVQAPLHDIHMKSPTILTFIIWLRYDLSGFCTEKLLFFPFTTLCFGSKWLSLAYPEVWEVGWE